MAIIKYIQDAEDVTLGILPDVFASEKEKQSDDYIKKTMDHLAVIGHAQIRGHLGSDGFVHNYNLVKGILRPEDFYMNSEPTTRSFVDTLLKNVELPEHVVHYSILNPPINTLMGEKSKRPDFSKVKAFDEDSKSEELEYRTELMTNYIMGKAREAILMQVSQSGQQVSDEDVQKMTLDKVHDELTTYTSMAERWANNILTLSKIEFNFRELSDEGFRDLLITSREYYHVFEDNTKTGFGVEVMNPANVWTLQSGGKHYTSDQSGREQGAFAAGTIDIMELSEIIQRFKLPKEEIDSLREYNQEFPHLNVRPSSFETSATGDGTIKYDTYSRLLAQDSMMSESEMKGQDALQSFLGDSPQVTSYHNKFVVVQSYHLTKKKIGLVTYIDDQGDEKTDFVDENYSPIPTQIGPIKWTWANQWMKGLKIGHQIYHLEPYKLLPYCPIIGVIHENKNVSRAKSFVDMLKNFQTIYNICVNQIFKLLEKEIGNFAVIPLGAIPIPKDGDAQDSLDIAEEEMRRSGRLIVNDDPSNPRAVQAIQGIRNIPLDRSNEISARWNLAIQMKREAWELVGITPARTGSTLATQTATSIQTEITQSYAQTEPYFVQHEHLINQVYQAIIDAAQYITIQDPESTISYISSEGEQAFMKINTDEIKMRDLKVFVTSRAEDEKMFEELRQLSQPMLQNGASIYDVTLLYSTNSIRQIKDIFKSLKEKQDQFQQQQQQMEQTKMQQEQGQAEMQIQAAAQEGDKQRQNDNYNKELDRLSKERIAIISATGYGKEPAEDTNGNGVPDVLEASKLGMEHSNALQDRSLKQQELSQKQRELLSKNDIEREKLKVERDNMANDLAIAKIQAKNRPSKKK